MRPKGVCNCPFKSGKGTCYCALDAKRCNVISDAVGFYCRGWLPNGKPSELQASYLQQADLFGK